MSTVDFRISIIPGYYGESAVIRILDPRGLPQSVEALGLRPPVVARLRQLLRSTAPGIILVTGPTGSGKSTTLFGALKSVYQPGIKILTAENPIEYVCDAFRQHEVDDRLGNTFATYLRSFLRHDPDVIMIGEIRDGETAELAFRAAQTGHLVLSTLHANDSISALPRLHDLGVDANLYHVVPSGRACPSAWRAQVCADCREPYAPPAELVADIIGTPPVDFRWYRGARMLELQLHRVSWPRLILVGAVDSERHGRRAHQPRGHRSRRFDRSARKTTLPMADDAAEKLREGRTNLEELIRALPHSALRPLNLSAS